MLSSGSSSTFVLKILASSRFSFWSDTYQDMSNCFVSLGNYSGMSFKVSLSNWNI